jgi:hypothetical protein
MTLNPPAPNTSQIERGSNFRHEVRKGLASRPLGFVFRWFFLWPSSWVTFFHVLLNGGCYIGQKVPTTQTPACRVEPIVKIEENIPLFLAILHPAAQWCEIDRQFDGRAAQNPAPDSEIESFAKRNPVSIGPPRCAMVISIL